LRTAAAVQSQDDMGNDLLMGRVDLTPMLDGHVSLPTQIFIVIFFLKFVILFGSMLRTSGIAQRLDQAHST
jgi:hypothetical protein